MSLGGRLGRVRGAGSGGTGRPPRSRDAKAATADSAAAATNTTARPWWNGAEMSCGKYSRPVRIRWLAAGREAQRVGLRPAGAGWD